MSLLHDMLSPPNLGIPDYLLKIYASASKPCAPKMGKSIEACYCVPTPPTMYNHIYFISTRWKVDGWGGGWVEKTTSSLCADAGQIILCMLLTVVTILDDSTFGDLFGLCVIGDSCLLSRCTTFQCNRSTTSVYCRLSSALCLF